MDVSADGGQVRPQPERDAEGLPGGEEAPILRREQDVGVDWIELEAEVCRITGDAQLRENHRFFKLYSAEDGIYGWRKGNPWGMSRRRWIERFIWVKNKGGVDDDGNPVPAGKIIPFRLNAAQRRLEAQIVRMERANLPVRIILLKARQQGMSTYVEAFQLWFAMTHAHGRGLIVAHRKETSKILFSRLKLMVQKMRKESGALWEFKLPYASRQDLKFGAPIDSEVVVDSAEVDEPGRGDTVQVAHLSESPMWKGAEAKADAIMQVIPEEPGTYAFNEGTAKGAVGWFHDEFWKGWESQYGLSSGGEESEGSSMVAWHSMFFPWFIHQEYRWTRVHQRDTLPPQLLHELKESLNDDERWLLEQSYVVRGVGWVQVDYDQLAWRRYAIANKCRGSLDTFHQEYPAKPEEAFLASGRPIFDYHLLREQRQKCMADPISTGSLVDPEGEEQMARSVVMR